MMCTEQTLSYALSKKVPDMHRGFRIETHYGEIDIDGEDAKSFVELVKRLLEKKLAEQTSHTKGQSR